MGVLVSLGRGRLAGGLMAIGLLSIGVACGPPPSGGSKWTSEGCRKGDTLVFVALGEPADVNQDLAACRPADGALYDNRIKVVDPTGPWGEPSDQCLDGDGLIFIAFDPTGPMYAVDANQDLAVCRSRADGYYYDNELPN
jgi:hypothetical protein